MVSGSTPQGYCVARIGGEYATVTVMAQPGTSPATDEPKPDQECQFPPS